MHPNTIQQPLQWVLSSAWLSVSIFRQLQLQNLTTQGHHWYALGYGTQMSYSNDCDGLECGIQYSRPQHTIRST